MNFNEIKDRFNGWFKVSPEESDEITKDNIDFLLNNVEIYKKFKIVDFGCGTGRHLFELYRLEFRNLIGVDFSKTAIDRALKKQAELKTNIKFIYANFFNFMEEVTGKYNLIFSFDFTFSLYGYDNLILLLKKAKSILDDGGALFFEIWNLELIMENNRADFERDIEAGDKVFKNRTITDFDKKIITFKNKVIDGDKTIELADQIQYLYSDSDIEWAANSAGFNDVNILKNGISNYIILK